MAMRRHKYKYKVKSDTTADKVVNMVGVEKRVLELGPGPGSITCLLKDNGCCVTALEMDEAAIEIVAEYCERIYCCDLNEPEWPAVLSNADKFSAIVAADVLEHLYDPWATLQKMLPLLSEGGYVVISLPHVAHNAIVACLLVEDFEYQPLGLLDKTHIRFFGIRNIQKMFEDAGYKIVEADFVIKTPEQTEFANRWRKLPSKIRQELAWNRFGNVYQIVVRAVPKAAEGKGLRLESLPVPGPSAVSFGRGAWAKRIVAYLISFLSLNTRHRISHIFDRISFWR